MKSSFPKISIFALAVVVTGCQTTSNSADNLYNQYRAKANNKAFSISTNNVAGAAWGAKTEAEAMRLAQKTCIDSGGFNCNVTEVNGKAVSSQSKSSIVNSFNIIYQDEYYKVNLSVQASGFFINNNHILTTSDMVDVCSKISYERSGRLFETIVVRVDKTNNIAVLKTKIPNKSFAKIGLNRQTTQGERTYTYGYDLSDIVNSKIPTYQGKITDGIISSASGKYNDVRIMRTTNEVNSGNVGGPVISENGEVIGLVTNTDQESIKSSMFIIFLNELNIGYKSVTNSKKVSPAKIAEESKKFSVPLVCLNKV